MKLDPNFLRQHYASLSDEALMALDRGDLVDMAQQIFDEEVGRRGLANSGKKVPDVTAGPLDSADEDADFDHRPAGEDGIPDWLDEAGEVYGEYTTAGGQPAIRATDGRDALEAAGIPCYLELYTIPPEESAVPDPTHRWRLMVPGELSQRATNVLERDVFNSEFEGDWKNHLQALSDQDLRAVNPQAAFLGLFDKIARITRAYNEELARRRLK